MTFDVRHDSSVTVLPYDRAEADIYWKLNITALDTLNRDALGS